AEQLHAYRGDRALVLALPPGGVAVAGELAHALRLPLDVLVAHSMRRPIRHLWWGHSARAAGSASTVWRSAPHTGKILLSERLCRDQLALQILATERVVDRLKEPVVIDRRLAQRA